MQLFCKDELGTIRIDKETSEERHRKLLPKLDAYFEQQEFTTIV